MRQYTHCVTHTQEYTCTTRDLTSVTHIATWQRHVRFLVKVRRPERLHSEELCCHFGLSSLFLKKLVFSLYPV